MAEGQGEGQRGREGGGERAGLGTSRLVIFQGRVELFPGRARARSARAQAYERQGRTGRNIANSFAISFALPPLYLLVTSAGLVDVACLTLESTWDSGGSSWPLIGAVHE